MASEMMVLCSQVNLKDERDSWGKTVNLLEYLFFKLILTKILKINSNTMDIYAQLYQSAWYPYT